MSFDEQKAKYVLRYTKMISHSLKELGLQKTKRNVAILADLMTCAVVDVTPKERTELGKLFK